MVIFEKCVTPDLKRNIVYVYRGEAEETKSSCPQVQSFLVILNVLENSLESSTSGVLRKITNKQQEVIKWGFHRLQLTPTMHQHQYFFEIKSNCPYMSCTFANFSERCARFPEIAYGEVTDKFL